MADNYNVCKSKLKTTKEIYVCQIDGFSHIEKKPGEPLRKFFTSSFCDVNKLEWRLDIYPNGDGENTKEYVSVFIFLEDSILSKVCANVEIGIRNSKAVDKMLYVGNDRLFKKDGVGWGNNKFIKRETLSIKRNANLLLPGNQLTIVCEITLREEAGNNKFPNMQPTERQFLTDMGYLFEQSLFTDFTISCKDGKEFKVHKCILGCRSPVFAAMFAHGMVEKLNGVVKIADLNSDTIDKMLRFIYSGTLSNLEEIAGELLEAADKYELTELKKLCELELANSINKSNVCKLLILAYRHSAKHLNDVANKFIQANPNKVVKTKGWKLLVKMNDPDLIGQLFTNSFDDADGDSSNDSDEVEEDE